MEEFQNRMRLCFQLPNLLLIANCAEIGSSFPPEVFSRLGRNQIEYIPFLKG